MRRSRRSSHLSAATSAAGAVASRPLTAAPACGSATWSRKATRRRRASTPRTPRGLCGGADAARRPTASLLRGRAAASDADTASTSGTTQPGDCRATTARSSGWQEVLRLYGERSRARGWPGQLVADHTAVNGCRLAIGRRRRAGVGHSDTGLFTIINYGSSGFSGLEVKGSDGEWRLVDPAAFPAGALLLNTADSMHRLSNGRLRSTPHRVIDRSPKGTPLPHRLAMIYFFAPSYDAVLAPHLREGEAARFEPIVAGTLAHNYLTCPTEQRGAFDAWVAGQTSAKAKDYTGKLESNGGGRRRPLASAGSSRRHRRRRRRRRIGADLDAQARDTSLAPGLQYPCAPSLRLVRHRRRLFVSIRTSPFGICSTAIRPVRRQPMAGIRVHRQAARLGGQPPMCICAMFSRVAR